MTNTKPAQKQAIIAISSHVARGSVGNRAIVLALETLQFPVWAVATISLPWHPGHGPATRIVPDAACFSRFIGDLAASPKLAEVGAVLTGYLGDPSQAQAVADLVNAVRNANPDALYVCDPVIGDDGGLYVPQETAIAIRDNLLPLADIATPNRFELKWLGGGGSDLEAAARRLGAADVLVTSADFGGRTGNLLVTRTGVLSAAHEIVAHPPNGSGDLTAALFLAHRLGGCTWREALRLTTASVLDLIKASIACNADELVLEAGAKFLISPDSDVDIA